MDTAVDTSNNVSHGLRKDAAPRDPTFRSYTQKQAEAYAIGRGTAYSPLLYSEVLTFHTKGDGDYQSLVDVGCGPGNATRDLAASFCNVVGVDASEAMIGIARRKEYKTKSGKDVDFQVVSGEQLESIKGIDSESVDVITSAMAAHWFDMADFYKGAAKILKPGGTLALWTCASFYAHPDTPNYEEVQRILSKLEDETLGPYTNEYNRLSRTMYDNLPLPWQCDPAVSAFAQDNFVRKEWDRDGKLSDGKGFFGIPGDATTLQRLEAGLDTASMVTRWREAHPDIAGTEKDCVRETITNLRKALGGQESFTAGSATVLLLFRKKA